MKSRHYIVFFALIVLGLGGAWFLVPRQTELALIHLRDKDFSKALAEYQGRLDSGDLSIGVVMPLCQLYLQYGRIDAAIALMERFVRENPSNAEARRQLAKYYQYSQRPDDYLKTLEDLARSSPSEKTFRDLSDIYNFRGEYENQIRVLHILVERYPAKPEDFISLANIEAAQGKISDARRTMEACEAAHPEAVNADAVEFLVSLLLDSNDAAAAARRAEQWVSKTRDPFTAANLASLLNYKGQPEKAFALIEPFAAVAESSPAFLVELTQIEIANKQQQRSLERLERLDGAGRLPDAALEPYLDLLLTNKETGKAIHIAELHDLSMLPPWLLSNLADASLTEKRIDFAARMIESLGESFLEEFPLVGAKLALARHDQARAAVWIEKAEKRAASVNDRLELAYLYSETGHRDDAIRMLTTIVEDPNISVSVLGDLANLYLDTGNAAAGLALFRRLKMIHPSPEVDRNWAMLEAKAGLEKPVLDWLASGRSGSLDDQFIENLFFAANDEGKKTLAVITADRLFRKHPDDASRRRLADAEIAAGRPGDALPHLRVLITKHDPEIEALYVEALNEALKRGLPVGEELRGFWSNKLRDSRLDDKKREEVAQILLDMGEGEQILPVLADLARKFGDTWLFAYIEGAVKARKKTEAVDFLKSELNRTDLPEAEKTTRLQLLRQYGSDADALPYLKPLAETRGGEWAAAYEESLQRVGRRAEIIAFWRGRAGRSDVSAEDKRGIGFRSLDAGEKNLAEQIFWNLARQAPAASSDVSEILFIWGPRPKSEALDWMEERVRSSNGSERDAWIDHLIDAGAPKRAIAAARTGPVSDAYLRALVAANDSDGLAEAIGRAVPAATAAEQLRRMGRLALAMNLPKQVRMTYSKVLAIQPNDPEALRRIGSLDYAESHLPEAKEELSKYLSMNEGDFESHFNFGEILQQEGSTARAREHFQTAKVQIEQANPKTFQMRTIHALTLHRLGRLKDSMNEFEVLLREQPENTHLRADYAAVLIQAGRNHDAERILRLP